MANLSTGSSPIWMPPTVSRRNSSRDSLRPSLSSSPLPGSSFFESKFSASSYNLSTSIPRSVPLTSPIGASLSPPNTLQRPRPVPSRPQTPSPPTSQPALDDAQPIPVPSGFHTASTLQRSKTLAPERSKPVLPVRSSTLPLRNLNSNLDGANRGRNREEMLRWVESEVASIEKETDAAVAAKRNLSATRPMGRRRGNTVVEPIPPSRDIFPDPAAKKTPARRGSFDGGMRIPGAWSRLGPRPEDDTPRKAKDWERWADTKVRARRRLDDLWREEADAKETEKLIQETQAQDRLRRERDARKEWERQAFLEKERQRAVREEQDRLADQRRTKELRDTLNAEARRQEMLEEEIRRIEREARRLDEELRVREQKRQQAEREAAAGRARSRQRQPSRSREPSKQRPNPTPEPVRTPLHFDADGSDSDYFGAEWARLSEAFKSVNSAPVKTSNKPKYQSPAVTFREAWDAYERKWAHLSAHAPHPSGSLAKTTPTRLGFDDIPWPVLQQPSKSTDVAAHMTEGQIASFILSPFHSAGGSNPATPNFDTKTRKARLREALLRWHPDKMARILVSIGNEEERETVKAGAESVARHLNALLARES